MSLPSASNKRFNYRKSAERRMQNRKYSKSESGKSESGKCETDSAFKFKTPKQEKDAPPFSKVNVKKGQQVRKQLAFSDGDDKQLACSDGDDIRAETQWLVHKKWATRKDAVTAIKLDSTHQGKRIQQLSKGSSQVRVQFVCTTHKQTNPRHQCGYKVVLHKSKKDVEYPWHLVEGTLPESLQHSKGCLVCGCV